MALFKILRGYDDENKLNDITKLPLHDGYAYYNTYNNELYIDAKTNESDPNSVERHPLNAHLAYSAKYDGASPKQQIDKTYIKGISISDNKLSYTLGDGTSHSVEGTLGAVTGVKGNAETTYRTGQVNITKENIGLGNVENKSSATIRNELTKTNITIALGYIPPTSDTTYSAGTGLSLSGTTFNISTVPVANGGTGATTADDARINLGLGTIATKASTDFVPFKGNLTSLGSGSPADSAKSYWATDDIPNLSTAIAYNNLGAEYTFLFSKGGSNNYGSILKWGYQDTYLRILRCQSGNWKSQDWEKINAGYADRAGAVAWSGVTGKPTTLSEYGITDAKIENGKITLGSNSITPLTAHQDISGKLDKSGGTMTGALKLKGDPTDNLHAATKQYVDNMFTTNDALVFKGVLGTDTGMIDSLPPNTINSSYKQGWTYKVGTAGTYAGQNCEVGDTIYCIADGDTANNNNWVVLQTNIDGTVIGPSESASGVAIFTGTTGKAIRDSGKTITESAPTNSSDDTTIPTSEAVWEAISGASGYGKTGTVTKVSTGAGLTGGDITGTGTIKANLTSETKLTNAAADGTETSGRVYPIRLDKNGKLAVNVPWENTHQDISGKIDKSIGTTAGDIIYWSAANTPARIGIGSKGQILKVNNGTKPFWSSSPFHTALTSKGTTATTTAGETYGVAGVATGSDTTIYSKWYVNLDSGITIPYNGMIIQIKIPVAGVNAGCAITIDNGSNFYPVSINANGRVTTHFGVNDTITLQFDNARAIATYGTQAGASNGNATINITGCWRLLNVYDGNTTYSAMSVAEMRTGTATSQRTIRADYLKTFLSTLDGTGLTLTHSSSSPYFQLDHSNSVTAKTSYVDTATTASANGGTIKVTDIKYDAQGHITGSQDRTITLSQEKADTVGTADKAIAANLTTTTNAIAKYSNTTGTFANSGVTIDANNNITAPTTAYIKTGAFQIGGSGEKVTNKIKSSSTFYIDRPTGYSIIFAHDGENKIWIDQPDNNFRPDADNTLNIGTQTYGWKNIFLSTGGSSAQSQGIAFTKSGNIKAKIGVNDDGGVGIYSTESKHIYIRDSLTDTDSGVIIKKSEVEFQAEDLKFTKDSKSASIVFNSTTNALDFVFA